ncbi:MAG: hypothetical protein Q9193_003328 [Seirophora villosa]
MVCVFPLSGPYGFLQRVLFYTLLTFAVVAHRAEWLIRGSLAAAMIYSSSASIHALCLAAVSNHHRIFDLDIIGVYCILSSSIILLGPMLDWCEPLRHSAARPIMKAWGALVSVGLVCAFITIRRLYALLNGKDFVCKNAKLGRQSPLRLEADAQVVPNDRLFGRLFNILEGLLITSTVLMFLSLLSILASRNGDPVVLWEWKKRKFSLRHGFERRRFVLSYNTAKPLLIKILVGVIAPIVFVINIVLVELYIMKETPLPVKEHPREVGQWGAWVGACFVLMAVAITRTTE